MVQLLKVTAKWTGFAGAPGYSNFFWHEEDPAGSFDSGAIAAMNAVGTFFDSIKQWFPNTVKWNVQPDVPIIESTTGELVSYANGGARTDIVGTATNAAYSAASGVVVTWRTGGVVRGRRVRGRTFLVPTANVAYDLDGTLQSASAASFGTAATALINTVGQRSPVIWSRPSSKGASDGAFFPILTATVPDKVAILKSRRD